MMSSLCDYLPIFFNTTVSLNDTYHLLTSDRLMANPVLSADILQEAVPGNIRKAEHFVAFLKKVLSDITLAAFR